MRAREQQMQQMQHIGGILPDQKMQQGKQFTNSHAQFFRLTHNLLSPQT